MRDLLFPFLSLIITLVGFNAILMEGPEPYDFRKTVVKVSNRGHGSGSVIDSNLAKSLILTNRHVCDGITMSNTETARIQSVNQRIFLCTIMRDKDCVLKARKKLAKLMKEIGSVGRTVTIMFNNHIIKDVPDIPTKVPGTIKYVSDDSDLCLIQVDHGQLPVIRISNKISEPGDKVISLSNPLFYTNHMTTGYTGDTMMYRNNAYTHVTAEFYAGSSGSPMFNEMGELVGVATLGTRVPTGGYIIPLTDIILFLKGKMLTRKINAKIFGKLNITGDF